MSLAAAADGGAENALGAGRAAVLLEVGPEAKGPEAKGVKLANLRRVAPEPSEPETEATGQPPAPAPEDAAEPRWAVSFPSRAGARHVSIRASCLTALPHDSHGQRARRCSPA